MMRGETLQQFSATLISLARLTAGVKDVFFARRLNADVVRIIAAYTRLSQEEGNVAQYHTLWNAKRAYESCTDTLGYLKHFRAAPATPLAKAQRALHLFYRGILRGWGMAPKRAFRGLKKKGEGKVPRSKSPSPSPLTHNQEKIFTFIKSFPNARTKDIIDEFNTLSGRTVKRSLRELMDAGFITKRAEHKAVFYSTSVEGS